MAKITRKFNWLAPVCLLTAVTLLASPALAGVELRVESRPSTGPIEAYVRVSDSNGSIAGLAADDFTVTLDGAPLNTFALGLPPDQDSAKKISVVIVYRTIATEPGVVTAISDFINQMAIGDYAALVRFQTRVEGLSSSYLHEFTSIDGGTGSASLIDFLAPAMVERKGVMDALAMSVNQFVTPSVALPNGPKAVILIDGGSPSAHHVTQSELVAMANAGGIPVFMVQLRDVVTNPAPSAMYTTLTADTGGTYFTAADEAGIAEAMAHVAALLDDAYQLTIPQSAVTDCNPHMLEVTASGESASFEFVRCDTTPDVLAFDFQDQVTPVAVVSSNGATISSIEGPVTISVTGGEYAVGSPLTFTTAPGIVQPGDQIWVRHVASASFSMTTSTVVTTGGVASYFSSQTMSQPPISGGGGGVGGVGGVGGGNGGGGSTGMLELLLLLAASFARRYFWRT